MLGLERIEKFLAFAGNPEKKFLSVHVAGTNGKGSVCAMVERILRESGFKTGIYTSPHLVEFNERIKVGGKNIGDAALAALVSETRHEMEASGIELSYF
jgi:dihydrofolate synthase/folylpolyglutamate synthase